MKQRIVDSYSHDKKKRKNNPPVGLVSSSTDRLDGHTLYSHDPHVDPFLSWAGKAEGTEVEVQNVSLHVHERIDPRRIVAAFTKRSASPKQISLFEQPENELPLSKAVDFYKHDQDWTNRLIAGDSLLVMNSMLQKEGMAGKVQMVYIDPPYGIKFNSNFQPFTNRTNVSYTDSDKDIPREPEMIQAFRDTWELGTHSYLTYLRNRLLLAKELLRESGSCFVQISDENLHHVRELMDEVFGKENFMGQISFRTKIPLRTTFMPAIADYLVWYARNGSKVKFRRLFGDREVGEGTQFTWAELPSGERRRMTKEELRTPALLPSGSRVFRLTDLVSSGRTESCVFDFELEGKSYSPSGGRSWKTNPAGIEVLKEARRIMASGKMPSYVFFYDDYPVQELTNQWVDTQGATNKRYVVQTSEKVVQRCLLMTTDPGDLVLDPTCGSGTTAFVAEQWGRRWITCDTSRVAVAVARQRLVTANFDYYTLAHPNEGVGSGFKYRMVPHITLGSITKDEQASDETLYDQPEVDSSRLRVSGPFTVEAVPCLRVRPFDGQLPAIDGSGDILARSGETGNQAIWRDELRATGIRSVGGKTLMFSRVDPVTATRFLHAEAEILDESGTNQRAVISFGPDFGPIEQRQVEEALTEARKLKDVPQFVIFAAFHFDPEAAKDIDEVRWPGVQLLKAQMSVDLLTSDLRKKRSSSQSYWLIGQPDVEVIKTPDNQYVIKLHGFDYYDPVSGGITQGSSKQVAMWFLDTDYDERSLFPSQVFFPINDQTKDWTKLGRALNSALDEEALVAFCGTESLPFRAGEHQRIAVKIIDERGIESFVIRRLG